MSEIRQDNDLDLVRQYESGGNYNVGFGGADLSNAPRNEFGFPIWPGKVGPAGISHAAGAYQIQPDLWNEYAKRLGINDFTQQSQDRIAQAIKADKGLTPWVPYNAALKAALSGQTQPNQLVAGGRANFVPQFTPFSSIVGYVKPGDSGQDLKNVFAQLLGQGLGQTGLDPHLELLYKFQFLKSLLGGGQKQLTPIDYDPWKVAQVGVPTYRTVVGSAGPAK